MEKPQMHITLSEKKPIWEGYTLYDFKIYGILEEENYEDS